MPFLYAVVFEQRFFSSLFMYAGKVFERSYFPGMAAFITGLMVSGIFLRRIKTAKIFLLVQIFFSLLYSLQAHLFDIQLRMVFFWIVAFLSGMGLAASSLFYRVNIDRSMRFRSISQVLIYSLLLLTLVKVIILLLGYFFGYLLINIYLMVSFAIIHGFKDEELKAPERILTKYDFRLMLALLFFFIVILNATNGFLYQLFFQSFVNDFGFYDWYWSLAYLPPIIFLGNRKKVESPSRYLSFSLFLIMISFVLFSFFPENRSMLYVIHAIMILARAIMDLFLWTTLGEMIDYVEKPVILTGFGMSATILGLSLGTLIGKVFELYQSVPTTVSLAGVIGVSLSFWLLPKILHEIFKFYSAEQEAPEEISIIVESPEDIERDPLTRREKEVLQVLIEGKSNAEIARELFISENTVKTHVRNIFRKYNVSNRVELLQSMLRNGEIIGFQENLEESK